MAGRKIRRSRKLNERLEDALRQGGLGIPDDPANAPAREAAARAYGEVYGAAIEGGESDETARRTALKAAVGAYLGTPPVGAYEGTHDDVRHRRRPPRVVYHPDVARVYAEHPDASEVHECEDCGLGIPGHTGIIRGGETIPFRRYFDRCPNCGGRVGYAAYSKKHMAREGEAAHAVE